MIEFFYHDKLNKEIAAMEKKYPTIRDGISAFERLCEKQFHPVTPIPVIAPAKLHRVTQNNTWTLWKIELVIPDSSLRPSQWPRMWFVVKGAIIACLHIASHVDNYDDKVSKNFALERISDFF
jgi:hypothetical protein